MMFEKFSKMGQFPHFAEEDTQFISVSSLEEVAIHLKNNDDDNSYDYYLVQKTNPKKRVPSPPPFLPQSILIGSAVPKLSANPKMNSALVSSEIVEKVPEKSANTNSENGAFLAQNAELLLQAGEIEMARTVYRAILKTGDFCDVAYAGLAICSDKDGMVEQAIQFAWDSVAFAPNKKGYQILSQLLIQQGRDQEAAQALTRAIKTLDLSAQEKAEYYKTIGNCMSRLGQNPEAERAYKKALELSPASDETQSNLGSLYLEQGQVVDAKRCYQDAIASNPVNDKAWVGLGLCFVAEGDKEAAHEAFSKSLERNLRNSTAIFHLVKCAYEIKKYSQAERMLSSYVEIAPVSPSLLYSLAGLQFHVGKKKEASITAKRILQIKADHQGARDLMKRLELE